MDRLDRVLVSKEWRLIFHNGIVVHLFAFGSDYSLVILKPNPTRHTNASKTPFRFKAYWLTHQEFPNFIERHSAPTYPCPNFIASFRENLQRWNKITFRNVFRQKQSLLNRLRRIDYSLSIRHNCFYLTLKISYGKSWK